MNEVKCDRCGKNAGYPPAYIINVYSKYDLSDLGQEFYFCQDCYREIFKAMTGSNQIKYYPVYVYPPKKDQWIPAYPPTVTCSKVTYTTNM